MSEIRTSRQRGSAAPLLARSLTRIWAWATSPVAIIFFATRAGVWILALFAFLTFEPNQSAAVSIAGYDSPDLHDSGWVIDLWGRYDSKFFIGIAHHGYDFHRDAVTRYPLYPALVAVVGRAFGGHYVAAGVFVSLVACAVAFSLLYRLARPRLGHDGAVRAVLYLAIFPMSVFLQAAYTESLFLCIVLAVFLLAERERWVDAWVMTGLALLTRGPAIVLVPTLAYMVWRARDRRAALTGSAVGVPLALGFYLLYPLALWRMSTTHDPLGFVHDAGGNPLSRAGPFGGLWSATHSAAIAFRRLLIETPSTHSSVATAGDSTLRYDAYNLGFFLFAALFVVLAVLVWRWFGAPYGLFCALSLALLFSTPFRYYTPLNSFPRYGMVLFPFFLALAQLGKRPGVHTAIVGVSAILLGAATVQWALWEFIS